MISYHFLPLFVFSIGIVLGFGVAANDENDFVQLVNQHSQAVILFSPEVTNYLPSFPSQSDHPHHHPPPREEHTFTLRQIFHHGTHKYPNLHLRLDVNQEFQLSSDHPSLDTPGAQGFDQPLLVLSESTHIRRLADRSENHINQILDQRYSGKALYSVPGQQQQKSHSQSQSQPVWTYDQVSAPDVTNKRSVVNLAQIAANAYIDNPKKKDWIPVRKSSNYTLNFGWESDGLRGHVFSDETNSTVILGLKGTSPAVFDGSETTTNDKINDNLLFSCCCGQGGKFWWRQVCDCQTSSHKCNSTCVSESLRQKNRYYEAARELYTNVTALYPNSQLWAVGHSLGGALSSLLGLTYGLPVVTFEAPGDAMPAARIGLPIPPRYQIGADEYARDFTGGFHFGHTADPIFMGTCNTAGSFCTLAGYAMESVCHTGRTCTYDTVSDFGWREGVGNHRIKVVINEVLEKYPAPAQCVFKPDCQDCHDWTYFDSDHSDPGHSSSLTSKTTSSASTTSFSQTQTETCLTPGWWGCRDESTTKIPVSPTPTSLTSTCHTPGWFWCKESTSTTITTTSPPITSPTSTCETPGWFRCHDKKTTTANRTSLLAAVKDRVSTCQKCNDVVQTNEVNGVVSASVTLIGVKTRLTPTVTKTTRNKEKKTRTYRTTGTTPTSTAMMMEMMVMTSTIASASVTLSSSSSISSASLPFPSLPTIHLEI